MDTQRIGVVLAAAALSLSGASCCSMKRLMGWTRYSARVKADDDANFFSDTRVLIIWPAEEHAYKFHDKTLQQAEEELAKLLPGDYELANLGVTSPGREREFESADVNDQTLHTHCSAKQGFVFTSINDAVKPISLEKGPEQFPGFLEVRLERSSVSLRFFNSHEEWKRFSTLPRE